MNASLGALDTAISHVADEHAKIGLSGGRLDRIGDSLAARGITLKDERSVVEDTNLEEAIAQLHAQEPDAAGRAGGLREDQPPDLTFNILS